MRLGNIAHLYLVRLKARVVLVQELFAVLGIAVGVALLFASQVASTSLDASVAQLTAGVVGRTTYQLKARGPEGLSQTLVRRVEGMPGVSAAVPVLERQGSLAGPGGKRSIDLIATDPRDVRLTGRLFSHFSSQQLASRRVLALPSPIAAAVGVGPLETARLQIGAKVVRALVGLELTARTVGALVDSPIALAPLAYAQRLTGMRGRITRLLVHVRPGARGRVHAELLALAAGRMNVEPAAYDASLFSQAAGPVNQSTKTFAAICALVGFMFAYCAMLLTTDARRGLIRELRRGGATRWVTVKTLLFDAVILALVASVLGLVLGDLLSILAFKSPPGFLSFAFPIGSQRIVTWQSAAIALGAGLAAACVGVLTPLRDIWAGASVRRGGKTVPSRWGAVVMFAGACVCLAVTTAIMLLAPQSAVVGVFTLILALLLALPLALELILAGFDRLQRCAGAGPTEIATLELRSPETRLRSVAVAATAAVAVFASVTIEGSHANLQGGLDRLFQGVSAVADIWVAPGEAQNLLSTTPFRGVPASKLARLPGVRAVGVYRAAFLDYAGRRVWVLAPPSTALRYVPAGQLIQGGAGPADARIRAGGWVAMSKALAGALHLRVGQAFTLPSPRPTVFRVAALTTNLGWPPGAIVLSGGDYARAWESADPSAYNVMLAPSASLAAVGAEIRAALGPNSGLSVQTAGEREAAQRAASHQGLERLNQIAILVLMAGVLATATIMGAAIWQRRRRFARMKVQGFQTVTLWQALVWESALLIGTGCLIGACFGVYGQLLLSHALVTVTGFPLVYSGNATIALASLVLVTVVAAGCISLPGYRAVRVAPYPWPSG